MTLIFKRSEAVEKLLEYLTRGPDVQPYTELSLIAGGDVQKSHRHLLSSARHAALRDYKVAFGVERGVGLKRLADADKASCLVGQVRRIRSAGRKGALISRSVQFDKLAQRERLEYVARSTQLAIAVHATEEKSGRAILALCTQNADRPRLKAAFEALRDAETE